MCVRTLHSSPSGPPRSPTLRARCHTGGGPSPLWYRYSSSTAALLAALRCSPQLVRSGRWFAASDSPKGWGACNAAQRCVRPPLNHAPLVSHLRASPRQWGSAPGGGPCGRPPAPPGPKEAALLVPVRTSAPATVARGAASDAPAPVIHTSRGRGSGRAASPCVRGSLRAARLRRRGPPCHLCRWNSMKPPLYVRSPGEPKRVRRRGSPGVACKPSSAPGVVLA